MKKTTSIIILLSFLIVVTHAYNSHIKKSLNNQVLSLKKDLALALNERNKCDTALTKQNEAIAAIAIDLEKAKAEAAKENVVIIDRFIEREKIIRDNEELDAIEIMINEWLK